MYRSLTVLALLSAVCLTAGCGDDDEPPTAPTPPAQVVETFTGTLTPFSARNHEFNVATAGSVTVTVSALNPDAPTSVGIAVGTWTGTACQVVVDRNEAPVNASVLGTATTAGTLCARIYDPSTTGLPGPVEYTITVLHF